MIYKVCADIIYVGLDDILIGDAQSTTVLEDDYRTGPCHIRACTSCTAHQRSGCAVVVLTLNVRVRTIKQMQRAGSGKSEAIKMKYECGAAAPEE